MWSDRQSYRQSYLAACGVCMANLGDEAFGGVLCDELAVALLGECSMLGVGAHRTLRSACRRQSTPHGMGPRQNGLVRGSPRIRPLRL